MSDQRTGASVTISLREIYDSIQDVRNEVKGIGPRLTQLEKDATKGVEAHELASKAHEIATKHEDGLKWLWRTVAAALITGLIAAFLGFMSFAVQLGINKQVQDQIPTQQQSPNAAVEKGGDTK